MSTESNKTTAGKDAGDKEPELPFHWQQVQGAIWLIGLAVLFWQGWMWPGILVLVAISGVSQGLMRWYVDRQREQQQAAQRTQAAMEARKDWLPSKCPNCGGPLSVETVTWTGPSTADCPYCSTNLRPATQS
ncbi:MAG: hypothetical protein R2844_00190 [Caldilineales bacterium]